MATITTAGYSITPTLVLGYSASRASQNVIHVILGRSDPDVTLRPAALRSGTLELFFDDRSKAVQALDAHALGTVLRLSDPDVSNVAMRYVLAGDIRIELDTDSYTWKVSADFQEVAP